MLRVVASKDGTPDSPPKDALMQKVRDRTALVGVCGLGYVGLPLAAAVGTGEYRVLGFDIDQSKVDQLNGGESMIAAVDSETLGGLCKRELFEATSDTGRLGEADIILICVPTPLSKNREPDLRFIVETTDAIAETLRPGQLIVLESTTFPGTTMQVMRPILERKGLTSGKDFFLAYSPEREDPGNASFDTATIPKVVGGDGPDALDIAQTFYANVLKTVVPVSSTETAEAVKLTENIFRAVNIALVNELKIIFAEMGVDVWEVIEAAKTKPFGFMPFYPGPGLGGHCIPIDPFYLTWKAREYEIPTRFIELSGEINLAMPYYVVDRLIAELDKRFNRGLNGARILILGLAYKKNVSDLRESPSLKLIEILAKRGSNVDYHDPFAPVIPATREHADLQGQRSVDITPETLASYDAVLIATDHDDVDYKLVAENAKLVIDTRNVCARLGISSESVAKA